MDEILNWLANNWLSLVAVGGGTIFGTVLTFIYAKYKKYTTMSTTEIAGDIKDGVSPYIQEAVDKAINNYVAPIVKELVDSTHSVNDSLVALGDAMILSKSKDAQSQIAFAEKVGQIKGVNSNKIITLKEEVKAESKEEEETNKELQKMIEDIKNSTVTDSTPSVKF